MTNSAELFSQARDAAAQLKNWADVSNVLFDQENGLLARAYPDVEDRKAFMQSEDYKAIRQIVSDALDRSGVIQGSAPEKSGKFVVRVPKSLHGALEQEANREGVSLNQLVVTKLAIKLGQVRESPKAEFAMIAQAYLESRDGYSTDRVIADPELDKRFLHRCRELGAVGTDYEINWKLMSARKNSYLKDMPKTRKYTPRRIDDFEYASEIALAHVCRVFARQYPEGISLDRIICDPVIAAEFDKFADAISPGFLPLEYRWAAFGVRKAAGRYKKQAAKAKLPTFDRLGVTKSIKASKIPAKSGIYIFRNEDDSIFIGETEDLRNRIERHFECSESQGIPDWVYHQQKSPLELGIVVFESAKSTMRKISELRAISEFSPLLNYMTSAA